MMFVGRSRPPSPSGHLLRISLFAACLPTLGCGGGAKEKPLPASGSAAPSPRAIPPIGLSAPAPAASASTAPTTLHFSGSYEASAHRLDLPAARGGLPEWAADDPKRGTGHGTIELEIVDDGTVSGDANGPLGHQRLTGSLEAGKLFARLQGSQAADYSGTLVATRDGQRISGTIQASAGDSRSSRTAAVTLSQK